MLTSLLLIATLDLNAATSHCTDPESWLSGIDRATKAERDEVRRRVRRTCEAMGATDEACKVVDAITVRESSGDACAVHVRGENEYGLGAHGLSWRWQRHRWYSRELDEADQDPTAFLVPEISTVVAIRLLRSATRRHRAKTWVHVGEVFAGRVRPEDQDRAKQAAFCSRLRRWGVDCKGDPRGQLGDELGLGPTEDQELFVQQLLDEREDGGA